MADPDDGLFIANGKHPPRRPPPPEAADRPPDPPLSPPGVNLSYLEELAEKELRRLTAENKRLRTENERLLDAIERHRGFIKGANNWTAEAINQGLWAWLDEETRARMMGY